MKLTIETNAAIVKLLNDKGVEIEYPLSSPEAFQLISKAWLRSGWDTKHVYTFSWMGRPIIQLPEDMFRFQEVIWKLKPSVIVEVGVAHGGSLIFSASICEAMGAGHVVGVDIDIRPHNREAIESHKLFDRITLIEGSSIDPSVIQQVRSKISDDDVVLVVLDGCHACDHVLSELRQYSQLVTRGSYIIAADGIMKDLAGAPRSSPNWATDNPVSAVEIFTSESKEFVCEQPGWEFNESNGLSENITYWPRGYLKRI